MATRSLTEVTDDAKLSPAPAANHVPPLFIEYSNEAPVSVPIIAVPPVSVGVKDHVPLAALLRLSVNTAKPAASPKTMLPRDALANVATG